MKLIKTLTLFFCLFYITNSLGQVTVQTSNLKVNGTSVTAINFNSNPTINVSVDVSLTTFNGNTNNTFGNLYLYFKPVGTENEVMVGFSSITFVVTYPPFVPQTTYTSSNYFSSVVLSASDFFATGGVFYAKYVNNSSSNYLSSEIAVTGGTRASSNPPSSQTNAICCNQTIRAGDKPALITGSVLNTGQITWVKGFNTNVINYATSNSFNNFEADYIFENTSFKRKITNSNNVSSFSNPITITVVPNPIISNQITSNASLLEEGIYEIFETDQINFSGFTSKVNLAVLNDPFHPGTRGDSYATVVDYQWQQFKPGMSHARWTDIANATTSTLSGFSLSLADNNELNYYFVRRIAKYQDISLVSNTLKVIVNEPYDSNTICCSQNLTAVGTGFTLPSILIGSTAVYTLSSAWRLRTLNIVYQWQRKSRSMPWANIPGANSKNYLPPAFTSGGTNVEYRRAVTFNVTLWMNLDYIQYDTTSITTYSNTVYVSTPRAGGRRMIGDFDTTETYTLYPNPVKSVLNISNYHTSEYFKIYNSLGQEIKLNVITSKDNSIAIDVSDLTDGIYFVALEKDSKIIFEKFIKQ